IRFASPAAITALGYDTADELLGCHRHETIHHQQPDGTTYGVAQCPMQLARANGQTVSRDVDWFVRRDGSKVPVSYVSVPIELAEGHGAVVAFALVAGGAASEDVLAAAISNTQSRADLAWLAEEQAALRRVATLVTRGTRPEAVFAEVANEVGRLFSVDVAHVIRHESDDTVTLVATSGELIPVGRRWPIGETPLASIVLETGRSARFEKYAQATAKLADDIRNQGMRSSVGTPILVEDRVWGLMITASGQEQPLPPDTEVRLASFTDLMATAIANAEARTEVGRLVEEQAALRRVATLVAEGAAPSEVFETVTREVGTLCGADLARMERYESGDSVVGVAVWSTGDAPGLAIGTHFLLEGASIAAQVREASRPMRVDSFVGAHGPIAQEAQGLGIRSSVGCPIIVEGRLWGIIAASSKSATPFPPDTESQIAEFTELVATAIANSEARMEVAASRARIVAAADAARGRIERDLHDGAQQRLVSLALRLRMAQGSLPPGAGELTELLGEVADGLTGVLDELRELARGLHPAALAEGGLRPALKMLARRSAVPVRLNVVGVDQRLPQPIELAAYYVVAEALANAAKHSAATVIEVDVEVATGGVAELLRVSVRDDGLGGADPSRGSGLIGLTDRIEALGGRISLHSPPGEGTTVHIALPLTAPAHLQWP
ncbi:MAG: histidine kinase, partial [Mycobacterium sp.]|nr:histidine kinase [Mycobacterium sp.]